MHADNYFILWLLLYNMMPYHSTQRIGKLDLYHRQTLWDFCFKCLLNYSMLFTLCMSYLLFF